MDRVFITSDWHLGGSLDTETDSGKVVPGMQICRSTVQIAEFIDWVQSGSGAEGIGTTELVVNGDIVDFLSPDDIREPQTWISDEDVAIEVLERIRENTRQIGRSPFDALTDFVSSPKCRLPILLGNHDIELSLPKVRERLLEWFGKHNPVTFIVDGEAYTRGALIVEHGNRYDAWNALDYDKLRRIRSIKSRRLSDADVQAPTRFYPPAGTLLVIHVINVFLKKYPFLNLLKPERESVIPLLLALEPSFLGLLEKILRLAPLRPIVAAHSRGGLAGPAQPNSPGNLSANPPPTSLQAILNQYGLASTYILKPSPGELGTTRLKSSVEDWINEQVQLLRNALDRPRRFLDLISGDRKAKLESLRHALAVLHDHKAFKLTDEENSYLEAARRLISEGGFEVVVFGHTHLPKYVAIEGPGNAGIYITTGTWADILRVPAEALETTEAGYSALESFFEDLQNQELERHTHRSLGYAEIHLEKDSIVSANLYSFTAADPQAEPFAPYNP
jgi:UDP-2,3-diacylglucosamine pyrophosphatase LpxH